MVAVAPVASAEACGITQVAHSKNWAGNDITTISYKNCSSVTVNVTVRLSNGTSIGRTAIAPRATKTWVYNGNVGVVRVD